MESPYYSSNLRGCPVQPIHQNATTIKPAPKVVQIPVHFVGSASNRIQKKPKPDSDRSSSALKIQKVFRGYLVRKYVKKIISIKKQVDEIERKLSCTETAELIRRNEKERLRVNETLMSLLLKLDSVRGIDSGVRDCRKTVIKKAISLQEKIDSIVSAGNVQVATDDVAPENAEETQLDDDVARENDGKKQLEEDDDVARENELEGEDDVAPENAEETQLDDVAVGNGKCEEMKEELHCGMDECVDEEEENISNRQLLEKMVQENEKMMRMMNELCKRNQVQTSMLNSLTQRVEQLEKAFVCDRLKPKKKKRHPA